MVDDKQLHDSYVKLVLEFIEIQRLATHYNCEVQGMVADNLDADMRGEEIPFNGEDFKRISQKYHNKLEAIKKRLSGRLMAI